MKKSLIATKDGTSIQHGNVATCSAALTKLNNNTTCQGAYEVGCENCRNKPVSIFGYYAEVVDYKEYLAIALLVPNVVCHIYSHENPMSVDLDVHMQLLAEKYNHVKFCKVAEHMAKPLLRSPYITELPGIIVTKDKIIQRLISGADSISVNNKICFDILELQLLHAHLVQEHRDELYKTLTSSILAYCARKKLFNVNKDMPKKERNLLQKSITYKLKQREGAQNVDEGIGALIETITNENETEDEIDEIDYQELYEEEVEEDFDEETEECEEEHFDADEGRGRKDDKNEHIVFQQLLYITKKKYEKIKKITESDHTAENAKSIEQN